MANTLSVLMTNILAGAMDVLREECTMARLVTPDFRGVAANKGDTVSVSIPAAQTVADITPAAVPPALTDTTVTQRLITIDKYQGTRFHLTDLDATKISADAQFVPGQLAEAARSIAYAINADVLSKYAGSGVNQPGIYGYAGTAATNPFASTFNILADVREVLNTQLCPDGQRKIVMNYAAETAALKLTTLNNVAAKGDASVLSKAQLGSLFNFDLFRDGQVPLHTSGTASAATAVKTQITSGASSFVIKSTTGTGTIKIGDVFVFSAGDTQTHVFTSASADVSSEQTVYFWPPINATVAADATITLKASHRVNLAFDPGAFALVMRVPPNEIAGVPTIGESQVMVDSVTSLPLKLTLIPGYHSAQFELSAMWGAGILDPRRACRMAG